MLKSPVRLGHVAEKIGWTAESTEAIHEGRSVPLKRRGELGIPSPAFVQMGDLEIDEMGTMREEVDGEASVVGFDCDDELFEVWDDARVEELEGDDSVRGEDGELLQVDRRPDEDYPEKLEGCAGPAVSDLNNLDHWGMVGGFYDAGDRIWDEVGIKEESNALEQQRMGERRVSGSNECNRL